MPTWAWAIIFGAIQAVIIGLWQALRFADQRRIAKIEQWVEDNKNAFDKFQTNVYTPKLESLSKDVWQTMAHHADLDSRVASLHGWKHEVGEAYLPRAVDDIEKRVERLEHKIFNGGSK
jgi:hypothetical protein